MSGKLAIIPLRVSLVVLGRGLFGFLRQGLTMWLKLTWILLPQPSECRDCRYVPPYLANIPFIGK
jgi:hypothetical protein